MVGHAIKVRKAKSFNLSYLSSCQPIQASKFYLIEHKMQPLQDFWPQIVWTGFSQPQRTNRTFKFTSQRQIKVLMITLRPRSFYQFSNKWASFIVNNKWSSLVTTPINLHHHILYLNAIELKAYCLWSRVKIITIRDFIIWPVWPRKQFP